MAQLSADAGAKHVESDSKQGKFTNEHCAKTRERYETISEKRTAAINARWERERELQKNTNEYKAIQAIPTSTATEGPTAPRALTKEQAAENLKREQILKLMEWDG